MSHLRVARRTRAQEDRPGLRRSPTFSVSCCIIRFLVPAIPVLLTVLPSAVMRALHILPFLAPALAGAFAAAPPHDIRALDLPVASGSNLNTHEEILFRRDGDHHHHHGAPIVELNETEVEMTHQKTPPSYYWSDVMDSQGERRYPGLMVVHILSMSSAFFGALPVGKSHLFFPTPVNHRRSYPSPGIALRSVKSAWHPVAVILFYTFATIGVGASMLYRKLTPDMCVWSFLSEIFPLTESIRCRFPGTRASAILLKGGVGYSLLRPCLRWILLPLVFAHATISQPFAIEKRSSA